MNGHLGIIALRRDGKRPRAVWMYDSDDSYARWAAGSWHYQRNVADGTWHAHVRLTADDVPEALDLRYLKGLQVHVVDGGRGRERFRRVFDAICEANAALVVGVCEGEVHHFKLNDQEPL